VLNISGLRSSPALTALTGVVLILVGVAGGWPPLAIVGALLLVLAALGFLTGTREPPAGGSPGAQVRGRRQEGGTIRIIVSAPEHVLKPSRRRAILAGGGEGGAAIGVLARCGRMTPPDDRRT
jgi:hypothetical protein